MKKLNSITVAVLFVTAFIFFIPVMLSAGDLDPSSPPDPTMHTLEDIYNAVTDGCACANCDGAPVAKTGQTTSYTAGDDGDLEKGVAGPSPRFTDNGDSTVTDNLTGLMWLKNANCIGSNYPDFDNDSTPKDGKVTWQHAFDFVAGINNGTYSNCSGGYADWRLPNKRELISITDDGQYSPALPAGHPFTGVPCPSCLWWSSTTGASRTGDAWHVGLVNGGVDFTSKSTGSNYVWPVRSLN